MERLKIVVPLCAALLTSVSAQAQESGEIALEEIVIEGEKLPRLFIDTYSSVGVVTTEEIETYKVDELTDAFNLLANVRAFQADRGENGFVIRGVNSEGITQPVSQAPVTSVIIDGATQSVEGTRRGARGTWDVEQIEVFRGPQSTLQGRNSLAGAVFINTKDPTYTWEAEAKGLVGDYDRRDGAFVVSGPLIENQLAFRIAGEFREQEKDITYDNPANEDLAEDEFRNVRGKVLIEPKAIAGLSVLLTASHTFDKPGVTAVTGPDFFDREFNPDGGATRVELRETENDNLISEVSYKLSEDVTLKSISSKIDTETKIDSADVLGFFRDETREDDDFTQDVRVEFGRSEQVFSGVVGAFYGDFKRSTDGILSIEDLDPTSLSNVQQSSTTQDQTESKAIYADLRYRFLPQWSVIGGARYTNEVVENFSEGALCQGPSFGGTCFGVNVPLDLDAEQEFEAFLPKLGLAYELDKQQTISLTAQQGFRSGYSEVIYDFSGVFTGDPILASINDVDPEYLWSYELGYKLQSADKRLTFGATAFYYDFEDQQIPVFYDSGIPFTFTLNAGQSHSYGAEFEGRYDFQNGLNVFGSVGLLKTEFDELEVTNFNLLSGLPTTSDFSGNEFPEAPQLTFSFGGNYKHSSGLFLSADMNYTSSYYSSGSISNDPEIEVDSYVVVNARAGYENDNLKLTAFVDNLFDEDYLTSLSNNDQFGTNPVEATIGDGRTIGVELRVKFTPETALEAATLK